MSFNWNGESTNQTGTVYTTCTGNIVFSDDDVRAVYIDWDDGTDLSGTISNKKEFANYQWVQLTKPTGTIDVEHTYTATGTYKPIIQVINSFGFVSNYYGMDTSNSDVSPYTEGATNKSFETTDGTATGVMNVENKRVLSGIDNSIFNSEGPKNIYIMIPPLATAATLADVGDITLEITCVVDHSLIDTGSSATAIASAGQMVQTITKTITNANITGGTGMNLVGPSDGLTGGLVSQVLKVKYLNPKFAATSSQRYDNYSQNAAFQNLKIFVCTTSYYGDGSTNVYYYPVSYVTAGAPIKSVEDSTRFINMDFSQSRAKASNVTNSYYRYDVGKGWYNPSFKWDVVSGTHTSDKYQFFGSNTSGTASSKRVAFAYNNVRPDGLAGTNTSGIGGDAALPGVAFSGDATNSDWILTDGASTPSQVYRTNQFIVDDFGRFTDQYHLVRTSMQPASQTSYPPTSTATEYTSSLTSNKPYVWRITPAITPYAPASTTNVINKMTKVDYNTGGGASASHTEDFTENAFRNTSGTAVNLSGMNAATFTDLEGNTRTANEYLLLLFPKKSNKIFFNIANYAQDLISTNLSGGGAYNDPWEISGVSYLTVEGTGIKQNAYWKNVPFEDTTKVSMEYRDTGNKKYVEQSNSLSQSGYINFDMPLDWDAISLANLCGGQFDTNTQTSGSYDLLLTGAGNDVASDGIYGKHLVLALETPSKDLLTSTFNNTTEVGAFNYLALVQDRGVGAGADCLNIPIWVAGPSGSDGINNAMDEVYLMYGEGITSAYEPVNLDGNTGTIILLRRINIYDVITGVSKMERGTTNSYPPVNAASGASFPQTYFLSGGQGGLTTFGDAVVDAWKDTDLYALKISLSGNVGQDAYPEIFNIFDATESHVELITETDDTAFNLNSIPITSDVQIARAGTYYRAITKKGKVFISRTGDSIQTINFTSAATGDTRGSSAFADSGPGTLYGNLHMVRKLQQENVRVYWDEIQKDGTFVRFWGVVTTVNETHGKSGPMAVKKYSFTVTVSEIALIDSNSKLMTDIFPLGGIQSETNYS